MIISAAFIGISCALFVYWFRYTCLLILSTRPAQDFARGVAEAHCLSFIGVQETLGGQVSVPDLDALQKQLDVDYAVIMRLMGECNGGVDALEAGMLKLHYSVMRRCYGVARRVSSARARTALQGMADTVSHFAAVMGAQAEGMA